MPISSRCAAATSREYPLTSISHGTDQRPWMAMNEPMATEPSGAIHHRRRLPKTLLTPCHWALHPATLGGGGVSGTSQKIAAAAANVDAASATKMTCHETNDNTAASGAVDSSAPAPPATIIHPESEGWRSAGYHAAIAFNGAMRQTATPAPINARANVSPPTLSLAANASAPQPATLRSTGSTRRGP